MPFDWWIGVGNPWQCLIASFGIQKIASWFCHVSRSPVRCWVVPLLSGLHEILLIGMKQLNIFWRETNKIHLLICFGARRRFRCHYRRTEATISKSTDFDNLMFECKLYTPINMLQRILSIIKNAKWQFLHKKSASLLQIAFYCYSREVFIGKHVKKKKKRNTYYFYLLRSCYIDLK